MIDAIELLCAFNSDHVANIFNDADQLLPAHLVPADITGFLIGNIMASFAEPDLPAHHIDRFTEMGNLLFILPDQVQHEAQSRLPANAGKFREFIDRIFKQG